MTTPNGETQPQETLQSGANDDGVAAGIELDPNAQPPQEGLQPAGDQTGAEQAAAAPRTYSQEEWSKRERAKDLEINDSRRQNAELTRQIAADKAANTEAQAAANDNRAVNDGEITTAEAQQRQTQRRVDRVTAGKRAQEEAVHQRAMAEAEPLFKKLVADELAKEFGIDANTLESDEGLTDYSGMREKAWQLRWDAKEAAVVGTETFDSGQPGNVGGGIKTYVKALQDGSELPSAAQIDRVTARYLNQ